MKSAVKHWLTAFISAVILAVAVWVIAPTNFAYADSDDITCTAATGNYLNEDYLAVYRVPASMITYEANGGSAENNSVANAFDGDWNSYWQTNTENNGQNTDNPVFLNAITVKFNKAVTIESIVYASSSSRMGHGYPTVLNVYTANGGELSLYGTCASAATNDRVVFTLKEAVTVTQIKFEFRQVNTMHNWTATAKEICFLQPDNESANNVLDLFDDYAQYTVKDKYKSQLGEIRSNVKNLISYESALKPLLDRAEAIVDGHLKKDMRREFSTDPDAENVITQYGNLRSYAGGTLKMSSFGINRQVLGIGGMTGQTITVYVEANAGDPLPSIAFTQVYGDWRSWQSSRQLSLGKNVITFPDFITDNYSRKVAAGGPIHLINAYEPSQQSSNVKIYVEGGYLYPVFRKDGDAESFRTELKSYYSKMNEQGTSDVTELVGDHFIHTVSASLAYNHYVAGAVDPQKNAEGWDEYIAALLEFGGVPMDPEAEHFNEKNPHLYTNFRMVQPWAGAAAFAAGDHIGFITFSEGSMINFGSLGWGIAHEIGHALDVNGRTIGETTNNMWSKFALAYFEHNVSRNFNADMTKVMTPDETATSAGYFNTNTYNYQIWWNLEACHRGFWGNLDNMYRYFDEAAARTAAGVTAADGELTTTERMVYYSSLVVGEDLGYYYERFGFSFSTGDNYDPFKAETASSAYKKLIEKALSDGSIEKRDFKYWYIDADQYFYDFSGDEGYTSSSSVEIRDIWKTSSGYTLLLPEATDNAAHLGYEITEYRDGNWYVIGFTYSGSFTDTTTYKNGYVPQYKVRAYDRGMNVSAQSEAASYKEISLTAVCRIGNVNYNSITEAVNAANANDTIYICSDLFDGAIIINKNLTILPDTSLTGSVVITKRAGGALFTVEGGVTLTIGSNDGAKTVLDGNAFSQNGALIRINGGTLRVYNAELRNNRNTDHGGAVYNTGNSAFTNVSMINNTTSVNGGAIANFSGGIIALTDCTISGNVASANGGALTLDGKTTLLRVNITGNKAGNIGGAMYVACSNDARSVSVGGGEISGNTAGKVGSAIYHDKGIFTLVGGDSAVRLSGEIYKNGGTLYISAATVDFSEVNFAVPALQGAAALLSASGGLTFTDAYAESINVASSVVAYFDEDANSVAVKPFTAAVTLNVNGTDVTHNVALGSFVLPKDFAGIGEDKYISAWKLNGNSYAVSEKVEIVGDCKFTAELGAKYKVTLNFGDGNIQTHYVIPNSKFYTPIDSIDETCSIVGWTVGSSRYAPAVGIAITADTEIVADLVKLYKVTLIGNGEQSISWHEYSSGVVLSDCEAPAGKKLSHWDVGGASYKSGEAVTVTGDTVIKAVFVDANPDDGKLSAGIIALIVIIVILVVAAIAVAVILVLKRKKKTASATKTNIKSTKANKTKKNTKDEKPNAVKAASSTETRSAAKQTKTATHTQSKTAAHTSMRTTSTSARTVTPTQTRTASPARTTASTATRKANSTSARTAAPTRTVTPTQTRTATPPRAATPTATRKATPTSTRTTTPTRTATPTRNATPTTRNNTTKK